MADGAIKVHPRLVQALLNSAAAARATALLDQGNAKHNHYQDFGYPDTVDFLKLYTMYERNGLAAAAVEKFTDTIWSTKPSLVIGEDDQSEEDTPEEATFRKWAKLTRFWQTIADVDSRSMVGDYAGLILRIADGRTMDQPVNPGAVRNGLQDLWEVIPAFEGQLTPTDWDTDTASRTYGQPRAYLFNESDLPNSRIKQPRSFQVHAERVILWSNTGTLNGRSILRPGYNALIDIEKIMGAGGEGFWKSSRGSQHLKIDPEAKLADLARMLGADSPAEIGTKLNDVIADWSAGFDKALVTQGVESAALTVSLPQPEQFYNGPLNVFAASVQMPVKILVGNQTGERASTEDLRDFNRTCMSRRENEKEPLIMKLVERLVRFNILPNVNWSVKWDDLTESSTEERLANAKVMSDINAAQAPYGLMPFTINEIRDAAGEEPEPTTEFDEHGDGTETGEETDGTSPPSVQV